MEGEWEELRGRWGLDQALELFEGISPKSVSAELVWAAVVGSGAKGITPSVSKNSKNVCMTS
jgi:hypothetical protein